MSHHPIAPGVRTIGLLLLALAVAASPLTSGDRTASKSDEIGRDRLRWPSAGFRDLQDALDAVRDGGLLEIAAGAYELQAPLYVRDKRITIRGAGSGRGRGEQMTWLRGPTPQPVVDENGRVALPPEAVVGLFNFENCDATIRDLKLSGFDAGVVLRDQPSRDPERSQPQHVRAKVLKVHIANTGRGILSQSSGDLTVANSVIERTVWNAISVAPQFVIQFPLFSAQAIQILGPGGAGVYFENTNAGIATTFISGATYGGIVGFNGAAFIVDCTLQFNQLAGILLWGCTASVLENSILATHAIPQGSTTNFGDGIFFIASSGFLKDNVVDESARVGMSFFASDADLDGNTIACSAFEDLVAGDYQGQASQVVQFSDSQCGCGDMFEVCTVTTLGLGNLPVPEPPAVPTP